MSPQHLAIIALLLASALCAAGEAFASPPPSKVRLGWVAVGLLAAAFLVGEFGF